MQKFIIKLLIFSIPIIVLYNIPKIKHYSFHNDINNKINSLIKNNNEPLIIIGGDSRAERQVVPCILEEKFGLKTVNIGVNAGDIAILYNSLISFTSLYCVSNVFSIQDFILNSLISSICWIRYIPKMVD